MGGCGGDSWSWARAVPGFGSRGLCRDAKERLCKGGAVACLVVA